MFFWGLLNWNYFFGGEVENGSLKVFRGYVWGVEGKFVGGNEVDLERGGGKIFRE